MGVDSSTYVGVYLVVPYKKMTLVSSHYVTESGQKSEFKFCPNTGKEHKLVDKTETKMDSPWTEFDEYESLTEDEMDELDDDMFWTPQYTKSPKNTSIFILNGKSKYKLANDDNESTTDLSNTNIPILLNDFSVDYVKYINAIKKEYGSVEVKFGAIHYYN